MGNIINFNHFKNSRGTNIYVDAKISIELLDGITEADLIQDVPEFIVIGRDASTDESVEIMKCDTSLMYEAMDKIMHQLQTMTQNGENIGKQQDVQIHLSHIQWHIDQLTIESQRW